MSNIGLFAIGGVVSLLVAASMALLIWGAILDGRYENERRAAEEEASSRASGAQTPRAVGAT
jgi:hypothetical protein